jgi:uncharacterized cupin superfamily protein
LSGVPEAPLEQTESGLAPAGDGWFVVNVADAAWYTNEQRGASCVFETEAHWFRELGFRVRVLYPGQPNGMYHRESSQEDFLVLHGECLLLVEEEERRLKAWDFVHAPPNTDHIFVGAGDGPCVIVMVGARREDESITYPVSELARKYGASVETETSSPEEAYAGTPSGVPGRPDAAGLPWASS